MFHDRSSTAASTLLGRGRSVEDSQEIVGGFLGSTTRAHSAQCPVGCSDRRQRLLSDREYRREITARYENDRVRSLWEDEYAKPDWPGHHRPIAPDDRLLWDRYFSYEKPLNDSASATCASCATSFFARSAIVRATRSTRRCARTDSECFSANNSKSCRAESSARQ